MNSVSRQILFLGLFLALLGISNAHAQGTASTHIIGGEPVSASEDISHTTVAVAEIDRRGTPYLCTGSIISPHFIVTAGHCVGPTDKKIQLLFGLDVRSYFDNFPKEEAQAADVTDFRRNPGYNRNMPVTKAANDIALLYFKGDLPQGYYPIRLLDPTTPLQAGEPVNEAGYGWTVGGTPAQQKAGDMGVLRETQVTINAFLGDLEIRVDERNGRSSCEGDSGGPLYITENGVNYLLGATSRGPTTCEGIGIYTNILGYVSWLHEAASEMAGE